MPHISKQKLKPTHEKKLYMQLAKLIGKLDKDNVNLFLSELLGKEEKIMLAKRFAVIVMLIEKNSTYRIAQLLHMSPSTVERLKLKLNFGEYEYIEKLLKQNKKEYEDFWKTLEVILRAGMPPMGKGRWKSTFDLLSEKKNNKQH